MFCFCVTCSGDPDKCDHTGNTALHWSASNGHINCVSFLVNFGVNLWALNNDYHTAKDCAYFHQRAEILDFLDQAMAKQSALNSKMVQKLKEKAVIEAEKRIKIFEKLKKKASKKAEKEEKTMEKLRKKLLEPVTSLPSAVRHGSISNLSLSNAPKFSDIVNNGTVSNKVRGFGAVSRKILQRKQHSDTISESVSLDFKVRDFGNGNGKKPVLSLTGLRRDNDVLYVRKYEAKNTFSDNKSLSSFHHSSSDHHSNGLCKANRNSHEFISMRPNLRELFQNGDSIKTNLTNGKAHLTRTISEPDFLSNVADSGLGDDMISPSVSSIFERPGFGSISFRHSQISTDTLIPTTNGKLKNRHENDSVSLGGEIAKNCPQNAVKNGNSLGNGSDSIGSAGSLAQRNATLSTLSGNGLWDEDSHILNGQNGDIPENLDKGSITSPIVLFLASHSMIEYISIFQKEKIDLEALALLNEDDLKSLGLPLGPRKKILKAIERRKSVLKEPGVIHDSHL